MLFKYIFYAKPQTVEKDVMQLCRGLGIQSKKSTNYFDMKWPGTVRDWQSDLVLLRRPIHHGRGTAAVHV